jgi:hypothetical protein
MTDTFMAANKPAFQRSSTALLGPADADHYRVKVGRYGDRWYCDPLDEDQRWEPTDATWPSISTVKKASGSDWTFVGLKRVAETNPDLTGLGFEMRYETLKAVNKTGLSAAARRGTNIHLYCESKLHGNPVTIAEGAPGHEYMPAVDAWFDQHQPELVAAEYVVIHRDLHTVGYGGTPDGLIRIAGELYAIDWKSRGADSDHGAYPEEAEQIAAGARAQYMIVQGPNGPERQTIPAVTGGLVISIRPDGCRTYPINIDHAWLHWEARHAWWCARRTEREPIGRQWPVKTAVAATPAKTKPTIAQRTANLRERCATVVALHASAADFLRDNFTAAEINLRSDHLDHTDLDAAQQIVEAAERVTSAPFNDLAS